MKVESAAAAMIYTGIGLLLSVIINVFALILLMVNKVYTPFIINTIITIVLGSIFYAIKTSAEKHTERTDSLSSTHLTDEKSNVEF